MKNMPLTASSWTKVRLRWPRDKQSDSFHQPIVEPPEGGRAAWGSGKKFVPCTVDGEQMLRIRRVRLELLPQLQNLVVHGPCGRIRVVSPDLVKQQLPCQHAVHILCKELKQLELVSGEDHWNSALPYSHALEVDVAVAKVKEGRACGLTLPSDCRLNARHKLSWAVGLR